MQFQSVLSPFTCLERHFLQFEASSGVVARGETLVAREYN